jgi:hypothetical protein
MLIDLVLPAIKEKFLYHTHQTILLQQDIAPVHCLQNNPDVHATIDSLDLK